MLVALALVFSLGSACIIAQSVGPPSESTRAFATLQSDFAQAEMALRQKVKAGTIMGKEATAATLALRADWTARFLEFATTHVGSNEARAALRWCLIDGDQREYPRVFAQIHPALMHDPKSTEICEILGRVGCKDALEVLSEWRAKSTSSEVAGHAALAWARAQRQTLTRAIRANWDSSVRGSPQTEAELSLLDKELERRLTEDEVCFAAVPTWNGTLGSAFAQERYFHVVLSPGRLAPPTVGEDSSGKELRLDQFRGKVVLLEFYGHW
jgi:hypothetical protein